jgi:caffeoyl-CoA O-methyltransferase
MATRFAGRLGFRMVSAAAAPVGAMAFASHKYSTACEEKDYLGRFKGTERATGIGGEKEANLLAVDAALGKTAAKWSLHSERIEGLAKELFCIISGVDPYIAAISTAEGPIMKAIREKMDSTDFDDLWDKKKTMFAYGPELSTDPVEAQTIKMFTFMKGAKRVLEIGMFCGYGAASIIEALPEDGQCVSLDIDPFLKGWVEETVTKFPGGNKLKVVVGPAIDSMLKLPVADKFDLVFVDANKSEYKRYLEILLERDFLAEDAIVIVDNTLYNGLPYLPGDFDTQPKRRGFGEDIKEFNAWVANHAQLMQIMLPIRDGVSIIRKR